MPVEPQVSGAVKVWALFLGSLSLALASWILGWFDTTTELFPAHNRVDQICFVTAGCLGLFACCAAIYLTGALTIAQRIVLPLVIMFETALGGFLLLGHVSSLVEGRIDFPAGKSHTRQALLLISRAYRTHGKSADQYIQTMPFWSNLDITSGDFAFMQANRRPGDNGSNADEISSHGYFCAKVTLEETDRATRVLHAGTRTLPQGTVVVCPVIRPPL